MLLSKMKAGLICLQRPPQQSLGLRHFPAQLAGALVLFGVFGRKEFTMSVPFDFWKKATIAGLLTAISGSLFIYSLSKGLLSSVILASSAKVALTAFLGFWLLRERNNLGRRVAAVAFSIFGLLVIFGA